MDNIRRADGRTDRKRKRQADGQTDSKKDINHKHTVRNTDIDRQTDIGKCATGSEQGE